MSRVKQGTAGRRVSFQGELGAFSQIAARELGGSDAIPVPLPTFQEVFESVANGKCEAAVIPIENTLHGSIHDNYDHLLRFDLAIRGETFVRIVHNLIAKPGVRLRDIVRIYSHPVALNQCLHFLDSNPKCERTPFYDTAGSVKMVMEEGMTDAGAIASAAAAEIYGATILKKSIEDDRANYTRFFLLELPRKNRNKPAGAVSKCKTSVVFTVKNVPGALFRCLSAFALRDLNMTKIESRPLRGKPWEYLFYLDFMGHVDEPASRNALNHLAELADMLRVLGCYPAAR
ncbi:MAG: prephenate dehydratase [Bryobacterales bacterium]|jgi:prephenate dehydratase|nr:prephenate dehydratase [Bryobacterales bacterium]